jgi:hypothetical protein
MRGSDGSGAECRACRRFELEDAAGEALAENLVGGRVVERQIFGHQATPCRFSISFSASSMSVSVVRPRKSILRSCSFSRPFMSYCVTISSRLVR